MVILFALRYEKEGRAQIADLVQRLQDFGMSRTQLGCVRTLLELAGADSRIGDLFSNRSFSSRFSTFAKQSLKVGRALDKDTVTGSCEGSLVPNKIVVLPI